MATEIVGIFQVTTIVRRKPSGVWYGRYAVARCDDPRGVPIFEGMCPNAPDPGLASVAAMAVGKEKAESLHPSMHPAR
ncbi:MULTISPECIES: hypothetical protein [unclassified Paraburkholderia]|uniref:hypothetical protein n=1 Tax=unclassified Paraburkholderia TaxID=2615204 RepID=UPI002AB10180|nr:MULTISPECIES: hypothetical protein [unclassified Paraburkholderia]